MAVLLPDPGNDWILWEDRTQFDDGCEVEQWLSNGFVRWRKSGEYSQGSWSYHRPYWKSKNGEKTLDKFSHKHLSNIRNLLINAQPSTIRAKAINLCMVTAIDSILNA